VDVNCEITKLHTVRSILHWKTFGIVYQKEFAVYLKYGIISVACWIGFCQYLSILCL